MSDDSELGTSSADTTPLTLAEAAQAFAGTTDTEEPDAGQPEVEGAPEGDDQAEDDQPEPDDDGDGEDTEGEDDPDGQVETEENEAEPDSEQGRFVSGNAKYTLPDGRVVTISQLASEHLMDRDYRQKTMAHSEDVKSFKAQSEVVKQRETRVAEQAKYVADLLQSVMPPTPDPEMTDPSSPKFDLVRYNRERAVFEQWTGHLNYLSAEQQKQAEAADAEAKASKKQKADDEWGALLEKVPEFKDEKRVESFVKQSFSVAEAYGFDKAEIADALATDHRMVMVLRDAMAHRRTQANKAKLAPKLEGKPPVLKGGQRLDPARAKAKDSRAAMERLDQSGKLSDGVAALLALERKG